MQPTIGHSTLTMRTRHIIPIGDNYNHAPHALCKCEAVIGIDDKGITVIHHRPMDFTWNMLHLLDKTGVVPHSPSRCYNIDILNHV